jgi:transglutaminase-like putative cysteine protease
MVALSSASEIPSIVVSGILLPDFSAPESKQTRIGDHPGIAHAWAEFSDREIWTLADPAWGVNAWKGYYFGRNDGRHLSYGCINHEGEVYSRLHR